MLANAMADGPTGARRRLDLYRRFARVVVIISFPEVLVQYRTAASNVTCWGGRRTAGPDWRCTAWRKRRRPGKGLHHAQPIFVTLSVVLAIDRKAEQVSSEAGIK